MTSTKSLKSTVIEQTCEQTELIHSEDYALKLVLINGLRRKVDLCDFDRLKQIMTKHHFDCKESSKRSLLNKMRQNTSHFTVPEIYEILNYPVLQKSPLPTPHTPLGTTQVQFILPNNNDMAASYTSQHSCHDQIQSYHENNQNINLNKQPLQGIMHQNSNSQSPNQVQNYLSNLTSSPILYNQQGANVNEAIQYNNQISASSSTFNVQLRQNSQNQNSQNQNSSPNSQNSSNLPAKLIISQTTSNASDKNENQNKRKSLAVEVNEIVNSRPISKSELDDVIKDLESLSNTLMYNNSEHNVFENCSSRGGTNSRDGTMDDEVNVPRL